jgi:uncharacterized protein (TIRG00374 family)
MVNKKIETYFWNAIKVLIAIALLYFIFVEINIQRLIESVYQINIPWLLLAIFMYFILSIFLAYRFYKGLHFLKTKISYIKVYLSNMFGMLCSDVTPGRFGYAAVVYDLHKREKLKMAPGLAVLGVIGATDMLAKGIYALAGLLFLVFVVSSSVFVQAALLSSAFIIFVGCAFLVICWFDFKHLDSFIKKTPFIGKWLFDFIEHFRNAGKRLKSKFLFFIALTFIMWFIRGAEWYFLGRATGVNLPFLTLFMLHPLLTAVRYVPLTPAGIGLFEGIVIVGFSIFGVPAENALLFSFFDRIDNIVIDVVGIYGFRRLKK